jgi:hypothetical protein
MTSRKPARTRHGASSACPMVAPSRPRSRPPQLHLEAPGHVPSPWRRLALDAAVGLAGWGGLVWMVYSALQ